MSNEHYLVVSYFVAGAVCLGVGVAAYLALAKPLAKIAEAVAEEHGSRLLKRALRLSMILAALAGFLSISYTQGCMKYEQVVKNRDYLVRVNQLQVQSTGNWVAAAVVLWCVVVLICIVGVQKHNQTQ